MGKGSHLAREHREKEKEKEKSPPMSPMRLRYNGNNTEKKHFLAKKRKISQTDIVQKEYCEEERGAKKRELCVEFLLVRRRGVKEKCIFWK